MRRGWGPGEAGMEVWAAWRRNMKMGRDCPAKKAEKWGIPFPLWLECDVVLSYTYVYFYPYILIYPLINK